MHIYITSRTAEGYLKLDCPFAIFLTITSEPFRGTPFVTVLQIHFQVLNTQPFRIEAYTLLYN